MCQNGPHGHALRIPRRGKGRAECDERVGRLPPPKLRGRRGQWLRCQTTAAGPNVVGVARGMGTAAKCDPMPMHHEPGKLGWVRAGVSCRSAWGGAFKSKWESRKIVAKKNQRLAQNQQIMQIHRILKIDFGRHFANSQPILYSKLRRPLLVELCKITTPNPTQMTSKNLPFRGQYAKAKMSHKYGLDSNVPYVLPRHLNRQADRCLAVLAHVVAPRVGVVQFRRQAGVGSP